MLKFCKSTKRKQISVTKKKIGKLNKLQKITEKNQIAALMVKVKLINYLPGIQTQYQIHVTAWNNVSKRPQKVYIKIVVTCLENRFLSVVEYPSVNTYAHGHIFLVRCNYIMCMNYNIMIHIAYNKSNTCI